MKKSHILIICLITVFITPAFFLVQNKKKVENTSIGMPVPGYEKVDEMVVENGGVENTDSFSAKATFEIYTLGTKRIFNEPKYHNLSSEVFINASEPNAVNVTKQNVTWQQFFETLPFTLNTDCLITGTGQKFCSDKYSLVFILNDSINTNALSEVINDEDTFVLRVEYK